ncbi:DUF4131 domain-containing protein [Novosphingobium sp.]|uniref:DUF4131 domain-containing protein n=1 Tax=Novosphingobium sp. TaxID=1874826 RepID=UPI0035B228A2
MASNAPPTVPMGNDAPLGAALQHSPWPKRARLASGLEACEQFIEAAGFDRAPWLVVALAAGIAAWFVLAGPAQWLGLFAACLAGAVTAGLWFGRETRFPYLRQSLIVIPLVLAAGCALIWSKSALIGTPPIARPTVATIVGKVLSREERPAEARIRIVLAIREPGGTRAVRVRLNLDNSQDVPGLGEGAQVTLRARLVPPAAPMLPGGYDFGRTAWFAGLAATGSVLGPVRVIAPSSRAGWSPGFSAAFPTTSEQTSRARRAPLRRPSPAVTGAQSPRKTRTPCAMRGLRTCSQSAVCTSAP